MTSRQLLYVALSCVAAVSACVLIYSYLLSLFYVALVCLLVIVVCMESRVIVGGRLGRKTKLFWVHIASAVCFLVVVAILAFVTRAVWLRLLGAVIFLPLFYSGARLWQEGLQKVLAR